MTDYKQRMSASRERGSAMMEMVISLFVLAIGLMGTLAMQATGVNSNQRAHFATDANLLAADMADRILIYTRNASLGEQVDPDLLDDYNGIDTKNSSASPPGCAASGCSMADQRKLDESEWAKAVKGRLPDGIGRVKFDAATDSYQITVMWNHNQVENPNDNCDDLACFVYDLRLN